MGTFGNTFGDTNSGKLWLNENQTPIFFLDSIGNGLSVATLTIYVAEITTLTITNGLFYDNSGGTTNPGTERVIPKNAATVVYIRVPTGTARIDFSNYTYIRRISGWVASVNACSLRFDISKFPLINYVYITGVNAMYGDVSANLFTALIASSNTAISGTVTNMVDMTVLQVRGTNTLTGNITGLTKLVQLVVTGNNTLSGNISNMPFLQFYEVTGNNTIDISAVALSTGLVSLIIDSNKVLSEIKINQILADMWANKDAVKPAVADRVINLIGGLGNNAPTGQGIIDKAALQAYRSPNNDPTKALWTVSTRNINTISFYGTSITAGSLASPLTNRYTTLLCESNGWTENNFGQSSRTLASLPINPNGSSMYENMDTIIPMSNYRNYLFFEFGANDMVQLSAYPDRFYDQYVEVINHAINIKGWNSANIYLLTCLFIGRDYATWNNRINAVALATGVNVIDTCSALLTDVSGYIDDGVHPNNAGHEIMATTINSII